MSGFLLDTNVVSELRKKDRCAPNVLDWAQTVPMNQDFISVIVIGELTRGVALKRRDDPKAAAGLENWVARLMQYYGDRILPVTLEVAETWGRLGAIRSIPPEDGLLAATALAHGLTLVSRNVKHVQGLGLALIDPWKFERGAKVHRKLE